MTVNEILAFSQKLYKQIAESGMTNTEAIICADLLKTSLLFNDFFNVGERLRDEWYRSRKDN
jgi:hypothetical protein